MFLALRRWLIGQPLATAQAFEERLSKVVALAVLSSDALSSVAYATEEILLVLAVAATTSADAFHYVIPISLAIATLLWVVTLSYRQTIFAYPSGGGAYIVSKENLGRAPALTAGAALLVDYTLTVAVSVASGVAAITSALQGTSLAWLAHYPVALCLGAILFITVVNLRGIRDSGAVFAAPVYLFLISFFAMIVWGLIRWYWFGPISAAGEGTLKVAEGYSPHSDMWFLMLAAFSGGCTAMTGVEAISNGVPAFRKPESRNAAVTLLCMAAVLTVLFLGTSTLAYLYSVHPRQEETAISQFARTIFPGPMTWAYYLIQATTAAILILAANTSYADFPRLACLMAKDGYLPRQFAYLGDRLVYSNGIIFLAVMASLLVWAFDGDVSRLIPLYAIGVFLSFTLSQAGMVRHWWKLGPGAHPWSLAINALGASVTAVVLCVFVLTKFVHGAWVVVVVLPMLVLLFSAIGRHYRRVEKQLTRKAVQPVGPCPRNTIIIPVPRVHGGVRRALAYARCITGEVRAIYIEIDPAQTEEVQKEWDALETGSSLEVIPSPYRAYVSLMASTIKRIKNDQKDGVVTVLLAEYVPANWWAEALHNSWIFRLKVALLYQPGLVVTSVPFMLHD